jgi:tRNA threonylcarbamoyladenosine modification (KEOPS) complex Cgi121 subunit
VNFEIPELGQHVWISAFNTRPQSIEELLRKAAEKYADVSVQLVDLDKVPGGRYLTLASVNAIESFHSRQPIAKSLGIELLVYISGEKQIDLALKRVGVTSGTSRVAAVVVSGADSQISSVTNFLTHTLGQTSDDRLLDDWSESRIENVRSGYDIGELELKAVIRKREAVPAALERLAVERSALLAARK